MPADTYKTPKNEKSFPAGFKRQKNKDVRSREHLTADEVDRLATAANSAGRHQLRDKWIVLMAYRHGLRVSELCDLKWDHVDFAQGTIEINRVKNSDPSKQTLKGDAVRALRKLKELYPGSAWIFCTEPSKDGGNRPLSPRNVQMIVARAGKLAGFDMPIHPHMLRHACGYALVNKGLDTRTLQGYLGHRNIRHTVEYTKLDANRFKGVEKLL